jgi:hypothetical protein
VSESDYATTPYNKELIMTVKKYISKDSSSWGTTDIKKTTFQLLVTFRLSAEFLTFQHHDFLKVETFWATFGYFWLLLATLGYFGLLWARANFYFFT